MFHSTRCSRVDWNISSFTEWKYLFQCTNEKTYIHLHRPNLFGNYWSKCHFVKISIQIMNVYECNGRNIFMRWNMKCSIQTRRIVPLHEWEDIMKFVLYRPNLYKDSKAVKNDCSSSKTFYKPRQLCTDACIRLNARTATVAFASRTVSHAVFLIFLASSIEQTSKDCRSIGNIEHSNINVNNECKSTYFLHSCQPKRSVIGYFVLK